MKLLSSLASNALLFSHLAIAGFPPQPNGLTTHEIKTKPGVSISYKQTHICDPRSKSYAGYIHLPATDSKPYNASTFFWYFQARQNAHRAPTAIYLAGGPGQSSLYGATSDGGPCTVLSDSNSTEPNPWSWNEHVNMLYVDQPDNVGFSYDALVNGTQDLLYLGDDPTSTGVTPFEAYNGSVPAENTTFLYGTFRSQDPIKTANNSANAANALWDFAQVFFSDFPEYNTLDKRISFWGNSYGGFWVPASASHFVRQNGEIKAGKINGTVLDIDTAGWTNGCTDLLYQMEWYPEMAYNNTYGLQVIPEEVYHEAKNNFTKPGGCREQILACRESGEAKDPNRLGQDDETNQLCATATIWCAGYVAGAYDALSNRSDFDMAHLKPDAFPLAYNYLAGYFQREWVQQALGVPVNFTGDSYLQVYNMFYATGDASRYAGADDIQFLLDSGVKVAMVYGDRDYRCPWNGAEDLSLKTNWTGAEKFRNAGYQAIRSDSIGKGPSGVVRQHGNFSFSRVFEAGHDVQAYQPRAAFEIFNRATFGKDVATGRIPIACPGCDYTTKGPLSSFHIKNELPSSERFDCNIYAVSSSCTIEQYEALMNGTAKVKDFEVVWPRGVTPGAVGGVGV